jgi:hypothetical protein
MFQEPKREETAAEASARWSAMLEMGLFLLSALSIELSSRPIRRSSARAGLAVEENERCQGTDGNCAADGEDGIVARGIADPVGQMRLAAGTEHVAYARQPLSVRPLRQVIGIADWEPDAGEELVENALAINERCIT